jgi:serine/threonine protein kinase/predicted negative regulator of RcsB-dependent stress response
MSACLSQEEIKQLNLGLVVEPDLARMRAHLEACESCRLAIPRSSKNSSVDVTMEVESRKPIPSSAEVTIESGGSAPDTKLAKHLPNIDGYRILGVLGQGGMGIVYRAMQTKLNRTVALKVLPAMIGSANPAAVSRFRREATAAARLHHTHIIPIYDFGESRDAYFYAMELITGDPLNVLIKRMADHSAATLSPTAMAGLLHSAPSLAEVESPSGVIEAPSSTVTASTGTHGRAYFRHVARWMADAADALQYAHGQGIIHRDIKPANLILSTDGRIMVADFGLAKIAGDESMTMTGSLVGTLRYISPEQAMAKRVRVDHRTDIYSLGATMYELLCFQPAYPGNDDKEILGSIISREPAPPRKVAKATHSVPPELETICLKAMEKSPDARYPTARAMAEDLRRYLQDLPISAKRPGPLRRVFKFVRRRKAPVVAVTAAVLLVPTTLLFMRERANRKLQEAAAAHDSGLFFGRSGKFEEAVKELKRAAAIDPHNVDHWEGLLWAQLGYVNSLASGEDPTPWLEEAERVSRKALRIDPHSIPTLNYRATIFKKLGRYAEAVDVFQIVTAMPMEKYAEDPNYKAAWANLGILQALNRDLEAAHRNMVRGTEMFGSEKGEYAASSWRNLAALELQMGNVARAAEHIQRAVVCKSDEPTSLILRARLRLLAQGQDDAALFDLNRVEEELEVKTDGRVKRLKALALLRKGELKAAMDAAQQAVELKDLPTINRLLIALAQAKSGNRVEAREYLQSAISSWPADLQQPGSYRVTAEKGELWFESADELHRLRTEAGRLLDAQGGQP